MLSNIEPPTICDYSQATDFNEIGLLAEINVSRPDFSDISLSEFFELGFRPSDYRRLKDNVSPLDFIEFLSRKLPPYRQWTLFDCGTPYIMAYNPPFGILNGRKKPAVEILIYRYRQSVHTYHLHPVSYANGQKDKHVISTAKLTKIYEKWLKKYPKMAFMDVYYGYRDFCANQKHDTNKSPSQFARGGLHYAKNYLFEREKLRNERIKSIPTFSEKVEQLNRLYGLK